MENQRLAQNELSQPRFDEEATLLSARPVVPLSEVKHQRWKRDLIFGLVGLVALFGGTLYGTLIYVPQTLNETSANETVTTSGQQSHVTAPLTEPDGSFGASDVSIPRKEDLANLGVQDESHEISPVLRRGTGVEVTNNPDRSSDGQKDEHKSEGRRPDRHAAGALRQQEPKERRQRARNSDGLLRIQEIFEGPPRP